MAKKKFNFATNNNLPFFCVSAADGTNVVRVEKEAIKLAIKNKEEPADEVMAEIWNLLRDDDTNSCTLAPDFEDGLLALSPSHGCSMTALGAHGVSPTAGKAMPVPAV